MKSMRAQRRNVWQGQERVGGSLPGRKGCSAELPSSRLRLVKTEALALHLCFSRAFFYLR